MTKAFRAKFVAKDGYEIFGAVGDVYVGDGFGDPESAAFGTYIFFPDGEEDGFYCAAEDLEKVA